MTTKRTFCCNLCGEDIPRERNLQPPALDTGIHWGAGNKLERVHIASAETHLCFRCVEGLIEIFKRTKP